MSSNGSPAVPLTVDEVADLICISPGTGSYRQTKNELARQAGKGNVLAFAVGLAFSRLDTRVRRDLKATLGELLVAVNQRCSSRALHVTKAKAELEKLILTLAE